MKFSVLMSVYKNETPEHFIQAMDSVLNQTLLPDEIILVRDGLVSEKLQKIINDYVKKIEIFTYIPLKSNGGLGNALNIGLKKAKYDVIARMDTDDICVPNRFELQVKYMETHKDISVCGGQIYEFIDNPKCPTGKREVPTSHKEICEYLKRRNPFNHMTIMFRKDAVINAGSYIELYLVEDYYLWCRMYLKGVKFGNLKQSLVYARTGEDMYRRRGGYKYFQSWKKLETFKVKNHITDRYYYISTLAMRFVVQVLMPNQLRGWVLKNFSRKRTEERN